MNSLPAGYKLRPDGLYEKRCEFLNGSTDGNDIHAVETIIRTSSGAMVAVLRRREPYRQAARLKIATPAPHPERAQAELGPVPNSDQCRPL